MITRALYLRRVYKNNKHMVNRALSAAVLLKLAISC